MMRNSHSRHVTHRLLSSSFLGVNYTILDMNHKKELLRSLWAGMEEMRRATATDLRGPAAPVLGAAEECSPASYLELPRTR